MKRGQVIQSTGANYLVEVDDKIYNCTIRGRLRLADSRETNPVAVGDFVEIEIISEEEGVITEIEERKNCIIRKSTNLSKESHVIAANIDQAVFIHTLKNPETTTVFMDRFLAAAESYSIPPLIIFNKIDIYNREEIEEVAMLMAIYEDVGYKVIPTSIVKNQNLELVKKALKDKVNVIAGHSGTGKSSLINAISPGLNLKTASISKTHLTGRHTTTFATMHKLSFGGAVIDTPGIRAFGLVYLNKEETGHYFPEIFKMSHNCHFGNCLHINEPNCAVKPAVESGEIAYSRYLSYLNIVLSEEDKHRTKLS